MGLLDFDDEKILSTRPKFRPLTRRERHKNNAELEENFSELQNLGHREQSADFEDSPHADRQPKQEEQQI